MTVEPQTVSNDCGALVVGDARETSAHLAKWREAVGRGSRRDEKFLSASITSPPYGDLIDYGPSNQVGHGQSRASYLEDCRQVFAHIYAATLDSGVLWLVADSFAERARDSRAVSRQYLLPFELSALAEEVGWILREVVIWRKDRTRPWTHHGKFRNSFEYVLLLVKSPEFKFYPGRLRDNQDLARWWVRYPERYNVFGKIPDNVWDVPIPPQGSWSSSRFRHACPLPPELVRRMVLLTSDPGDFIYDPFAGIGTVPAVAGALKRHGLGVELNSSFVESYSDQVRDEIAGHVEASQDGRLGPSPTVIAQLRGLKYLKAVVAKVREARVDLPVPTLMMTCIDEELAPTDIKGSSVCSAAFYLSLGAADREVRAEYQQVVDSLTAVAPFTKYGVTGDIRVLAQSTVRKKLKGRRWHVYEHGQTWATSGAVYGAAATKLPMSGLRGGFPPLVSNVALHIELDHVGDAASADPQRQGRAPKSGPANDEV